TVFDALQPPTKADYNLDVEVKTKILKDRYVIELRVPTKKLYKLRGGETWKINIARDRAIKDEFTGDGTSSFFTIGGVTQRDYTAFRPMIIGDPVGPVFKNGDFNTPRKLNETQVKLWKKKGNVCVNNLDAAPWQFNKPNSKLELCAHPDKEKDLYAKLSSGILYQLHYGIAKSYRVTFRAKGPGEMRLLFYRYHADEKRRIKYFGTKSAASKIKLGDEWKEYSFDFRKEFDDEVFAPAFVNLSGEVCIDDVVIAEEAELQYHGKEKKKK
ncbi:MAG: hypothetical protein J6A21_10000, partial [Lentisphaeria bacterium]|nr:hypothetical protein [Lentisphaeria bacterium]